jgi:hypothetical protein
MFLLHSIILALLAPNAAVSSPIACEKWFPAKGAPKAVVVVTHGMNMQPSCMDSLAAEMAAQGFEVYRPAFSGHCPGHGDYLRVTAADWEADARRVHKAAALKAQALKKPLYLLAYSFTSLVFQTMSKELPFDKRAYLAPPFATKFWYPAVRWAAGTFPDFSYGTLNPHCGANPRSSGRSLLALDEFMEKWRSGEGKNDPTPLLAFAEPDDELVSFEGVKAEAAANGRWRVEPISNKGHTLPNTYHHLIVDEPSLGAGEWNRLREALGKFFTL